MAKNNAAAAPAASDQTDPLAEEIAAPGEPRAVVSVAENRWQLKEHRNPGYWICVPAATEVEDLLQPSFWANVARHMRPATTVEVHWDDATLFAEVYVLSCGRNWASVSPLRLHRLEKPALPPQAASYGIAFNGPVDKFRITRLSDNALIRAGFASEREAQLWLDDYLRKLSA